MLDVVSTLRPVLVADPNVAALVGDRVRAWPAATSLALPHVLLALVSITKPATFGGTPGPLQARVQVDCIARSHSEREALASAVEACLTDYSGGSIARVFFDAAREVVDDEAGTYRAILEFIVAGVGS